MTTKTGWIGGKLPLTSTPLWRGLVESWVRDCRSGQITVRLPDGGTLVQSGREPGPTATIELDSFRAVTQLLSKGELGFAEGYLNGYWSTPDLTALIEFAIRNKPDLNRTLRGSWLAQLMSKLRFRLQANSVAGAKRNIAYHYDLGNDFYKQWLDETMTYSSAIFAEPGQQLADAQREKYRRVIEALDVRQGDRILEIGCGWGGFAEIAAGEAGAKLTCLTISQEQAAFARARIADAGLADRVEIRLEDYRHAEGRYDKIVSIEMFEAVGEENWPVFFEMLANRLVPNGRALLQIITVPDDRFAAYRRTVDYIQRYIFPGGMLPSPGAVSENADKAGLELRNVEFFGQDYAETLRRWNARFQECWDDIARLDFDERFRRIWTYYLQSCEASFRTGATDVGQFLLAKS